MGRELKEHTFVGEAELTSAKCIGKAHAIHARSWRRQNCERRSRVALSEHTKVNARGSGC